VGVVLLASAHAAGEAAVSQWPSYNNDLAGQRFSSLETINTKNVGGLKEICRVALSDGGALQSGPLLVDGAMFVTTARETFSLDPASCKINWKSSYAPVSYEPFPVNRGAAYLNGRLYRGTPDGHLLALDAKTGAVLWNNTAADSSYGEFLSAAPIAWNGMVFMGVGGSDWGIRGRMLAFDAQSGRELWRFDTIPQGKAVGADSWKVAASSKTGGGGLWTSFTLDIRSVELFIPVGNPAADYRPDDRPGDNLFTNSIVVLDARTGALKWWYQAIKNDPWDYDLSAPPMLYRTKSRADRVAAAGKDGYLHLVDRDTHKLVAKTAVTTQKKTAPKPSLTTALTCPGLLGGVEWNGPALDAANDRIVVGSVDWCTKVTMAAKNEYTPGQLYYGGTPEMVKDPAPSGWITSVDAESGRVVWQHRTAGRVVGGLTPPAGGMVVPGDTAGNFFALDSATGKLLLNKKLDGAIGGGIITYAVGDKQYFATTSGNVSRVTFGGNGVPSIVVFGL
jgi:PQQ-dependent dehydrogenase (methanol/ethanol family)